ncbi:MAG: 3-methyl-2-oxobutanoate hydroxymethyltransferase [Candidatus Lokiarchaeota archaeon]|nr:3-methyl-2-oxobutanoate hydroxymethyltransferase [Candidatus Harpocratesius repetitus]
MSPQKKVTPQSFICMKEKQEKITVLTAYDYMMAKAFDYSGIDALLVGDSMGMVIYGRNSTLKVTLDDIIRHTSAVARGSEHAMVIADMPFMSFATPEIALLNAGKILQEGDADAVKIEGGHERVATVKLLTSNGIPVMGHIGLTPQYYHQLGGYKLQGKTAKAAEKLLEDAILLEEAGTFSIVLEMVPWQIAREISQHLHIPTIGIGAGSGCDGQVLVAQDMLGFSNSKKFKFVKQYANIWKTMVDAAEAYIHDVKTLSFPTTDNSFNISETEYSEFLHLISQDLKILSRKKNKNEKSTKSDSSSIGKIYGN